MIILGDALQELKRIESDSVDCVVTSPPYWRQRNYEAAGQIGQEKTFHEYLDSLLAVTLELHRVIKETGTLFWVHGDGYGSATGKQEPDKLSKKQNSIRGSALVKSVGTSVVKGYNKSLLNLPHRLAIRMTDEQGWILRNNCIWHKPNAMPQPAIDRFVNDYETVFFFVKREKYFFKKMFEPYSNAKEYNPAGRGARAVWRIYTEGMSEDHPAAFPHSLVERCIASGCPEGGIVLDPFLGSGTVGVVAERLGMNWIGIELSDKYGKIAKQRTRNQNLF